jgi:predicted dehydrogenase
MSSAAARPRWAILGTSSVAARSFLPALAASGSGDAVLIAGRSGLSARRWAKQYDIAESVEGYAAAIEHPGIDAVYVPLPNALHAPWAQAALRVGKAVLCEKPLGLNAEEAEETVAVARHHDGLLWEAMAFPFHDQTGLLQGLLSGGSIGDLVEIQSSFHALIDRPGDIRFDPLLGGGALYDLGCYPIRLARLLFDAEPVRGGGWSHGLETGVDQETFGWLEFPERRRLVFGSGFIRTRDTFTRLIGVAGEIRVTNPFHARDHDTVELWRNNQLVERHAVGQELSFVPLLRHIHEVIAGRATPRHLAIDDAVGTATAIDLVRAAASPH